MTDWLVLGAGGHARALVDVITRRGDVLLAVSGEASAPWDVPVLASDDEALALARRSGAAVALGIGDGVTRTAVLDRVLAAGLSAPPLVATTATVSSTASLAAGVAVLEHAHVGPGARLERAALVNTSAVVEHDVALGAGAHLAPTAVLLGAAAVGDLSLVGAGAVVLPGVRVGARCVVGAGAVVREDVATGLTVVGVPARPAGR